MPVGPKFVRWGILGTASIAREQFLPGLREAGGGHAELVASRSRAKAEAYANANDIDRGVGNYSAVIEAPDVDAVYVALPNSLHAEWTIRALRAGKAVLCEKPLSDVANTAKIIDASASSGRPAWEAFVFPFQAQHQRLLTLLSSGAIGRLDEIFSAFHAPLAPGANIRLDPSLGGGALADVGCYPIRLAYELFCSPDVGNASPGDVHAISCSSVREGEVEVDAAGVVDFGPGRRLLLSCGFKRAYDPFTRILGSEGQIHLTSPFHPYPNDTVTVYRPGAEPLVERPTTDAHAFTAAIRHIQAVLRDEVPPIGTADEFSLPTARTLEQLQALARP